MGQIFQTDVMTGYFDVKVYNAKLTKEQQQMKGDNDTITFRAVYDQKPSLFSITSVKEFTNKNGEQRYAVTFKINNKVHWFDANGNEIARPTNAELDGKRFDAVISCRELHGDPKKMEPCGLWANAIQIRENKPVSFGVMGACNVAQPEEITPETANEADAEGLPF